MENQNLKKIIADYTQCSQLREISSLIGNEEVNAIQLNGLSGASSSLATIGLAHHFPHLVCMLPTREEAAYFFSNLESLAPELNKGYLPDSFKKAGDFSRLKKEQLKDRTEVINRISTTNQKFVLVTYIEALFEKLISPGKLREKQIKLIKGEEIDLEFLMEILISYGFIRVDFVSEPGEFSIRGGIVDLFSYGSEWPYRVELFGDEVESIRLFHPLDQLSIKQLERVSIVPNVENQMEQSDRVSLFDVLPEDSILIIEEESAIIDGIQHLFEVGQKTPTTITTGDEDEAAINYLKTNPFVTTREIADGLQKFKKIRLGNYPEFRDEETISFNSEPQPNFNKNFKLLIEDLERKESAGYQCFLFTDNARQYNRITAILSDMEATTKLHPVMASIDRGFSDKDLKIACYTDHEIFRRFHKYKVKRGFSKDQAIQLRMIKEMQPGDYVTHMDHGIGRYSGLEKIDINGHIQESVRLLYKNNDILYVSIHSLHKISRYIGKDDTPPKLSKLGSDVWAKTKAKTKKKVKDIASKLIKLYAARKGSDGFAFPEDGYLQNELEASFIYEDTPDQETATETVKADMQKPHPMDRLICGDVGFGKTEVAIRGVFKAVLGGKQVAVLVPTTILALQHFNTFNDRLAEFGVKVEYINRFKTAKQKKEILEGLQDGKIDVVIGTHGLLNKKVKFKDLGLLVVDEEQKFGVTAKEKLRAMKVNVDTLTLTATPIPRTLQFSLMGARDMSILRTAPPNRQPIHTEMRAYNPDVIRDAIYYEIERGGQVFFVHNRVKNLPDILVMLKKMCPDVDFSIAHGQMEAKKLEETLMNFIHGNSDVLLCTNIIETGLDIANVNTIIINNAHHFGLSDLHQLRGRVGRSNTKAYCYLITPPFSALTPDARKRLKTVEEFSDLGSGIHIAMRDLDIRGAGSLLGAEQSGFISDIGYDAYQKILEEAIIELKETEFSALFEEELTDSQRTYVREVELDMDIEMLIPDNYISNIKERLKIYKELDELGTEEELTAFAEKLKDRFGPLPKEVENLMEAFRIRWVCKKLGIERLILKNKVMKCFFPSNPQSTYYNSPQFSAIMQFVAEKGRNLEMQLKQSRESLILMRKNVKSLEQLKGLIDSLKKAAKI